MSDGDNQTLSIPQRYLALHRLNAPSQNASLRLTPSLAIVTGAVKVLVGETQRTYMGNGASHVLGSRTVTLDDGTYLAISTEVDVIKPNYRETAVLDIAELGTLFELIFPKLIAEASFEGFISTPSNITWVPPYAPVTIHARPFEGLDAVADAFADAAPTVLQVDSDRRERFRAAARWFRRGCDTTNPVDRFLFWYIALEVYPTDSSSTDVVRYVRDLIGDRVYPQLDRNLVKERIGIGPICSTRGRIVHKGLAFVARNDDTFMGQLERLGAIVRTCLRLLIDLPHGNDLDRWVVAVDT